MHDINTEVVLPMIRILLVASLLLVVRPGAPSSFLFLKQTILDLIPCFFFVSNSDGLQLSSSSVSNLVVL